MADSTGNLESRWTTVGGNRVHACVSVEPIPPGRLPVVLVHGLSVSSRYMLPTAQHLAPYYQVYAPDLPGFGKSDKPQHILTIAELAGALAEYMDAAGVKRAAMVANSLGCQIVVEFALRYPERIDRAVLIGPTMDSQARTMRQQFWRLVRDSVREPFSQPFVVLIDYLKTGLRRTLVTLRYALDDPLEEKLPQVRVPMLVTRGGRDPIVPQQWVEEVARLLPLARVVVFPEEAHTVNYSDPAELVRVIRPFIDAGSPAGVGRVTPGCL